MTDLYPCSEVRALAHIGTEWVKAQTPFIEFFHLYLLSTSFGLCVTVSRHSCGCERGHVIHKKLVKEKREHDHKIFNCFDPSVSLLLIITSPLQAALKRNYHLHESRGAESLYCDRKTLLAQSVWFISLNGAAHHL